jgi:hypothetical protein
VLQFFINFAHYTIVIPSSDGSICGQIINLSIYNDTVVFSTSRRVETECGCIIKIVYLSINSK